MLNEDERKAVSIADGYFYFKDSRVNSPPTSRHLLREHYIRYITAGNPNTPAEILAKLSVDVDSNVRRRVAENPCTPAPALRQLSYDPSVEVRLGVAENPSTPQEILELLAADDDVDVRFGIAENPHLPLEYLKQLADDENPYVACRARKTQAQIGAASTF